MQLSVNHIKCVVVLPYETIWNKVVQSYIHLSFLDTISDFYNLVAKGTLWIKDINWMYIRDKLFMNRYIEIVEDSL